MSKTEVMSISGVKMDVSAADRALIAISDTRSNGLMSDIDGHKLIGPENAVKIRQSLAAAGFVIVPKEPTQDMTVIGLQALVQEIQRQDPRAPKDIENKAQAYMNIGASMRTGREVNAAYRAMLAAASQEPKP